MTRTWISFPVALLAVTAATAQTPDAGPFTVRLSADDCQRLIPHTPAPDVAYRPGADVHGRDVAPATLAVGPSSPYRRSMSSSSRSIWPSGLAYRRRPPGLWPKARWASLPSTASA